MPWYLYIVLGILLFNFVVVLYIFFKKFKKVTFSEKELRYINSHWYRIIDMSKANPNGAIMDASKLLDYCLLKNAFLGSLGEKLKKAGPRFSNLDGVWKAHKLRNQVAHELSDINLNDAKYALSQFKRAMNDLGAKL